MTDSAHKEMTTLDGNDYFARFVHRAHWDTLPAEVQSKAKLCLLDALGAALSGTLTAVSRIAADYAVEAWKGNEATILLRGRKATAAGAAFANGYAANGFDSDDGALYTRGHPGAQLIPTALALAEKLGRSGAEMLTAIVVGYEVAIRAGRCWHQHHAVYQACGSWGSVATAACAAHLLRLSEEQIRQALGIAEYHAPNLPMMRDVDHPAMVKHGIGWGAVTGITAAELAARGFTGIPSLLGFETYHDWVADIGAVYLMTDGVTFKEFASCGWGHTAIVAVRELRKVQPFAAGDIESMLVEGYHETVRLGARLPASTEAAQFNVAWPLAAFLIDGEVGPRQMRAERLTDPRLIDLACRITLVENPVFSEWARLKYVGDPGGKYACQVHVTLKDGRQLKTPIVTTSHDYGRDWDQERLAGKFRWLVQEVVPPQLIDELVDMVWAFDQLPNVCVLTERLQ